MDNSNYSSKANPDRFLATTPYERQLAKAGVPRMFWNPELGKVKFQTTNFGPDKLSGTAQRQWVKAIAKHSMRVRPLVVATSGPTDNGALYLAHLIIAKLAKEGKNSVIINTAETVPHFEEYPYCIVLHNILGSTPERLQKIRDVMLKFQFVLKILIPVAEDDPYHWCASKLGKYPTVAIKVADMGQEVG